MGSDKSSGSDCEDTQKKVEENNKVEEDKVEESNVEENKVEEDKCDATTLPSNKSVRIWSIVTTCIWGTWCLLTISLFLYIAAGLIILYSTEAKMEIIFANRINQPWFANLSDCNSFGIVKCENMIIHGNAGNIGAWLISPSSKQYVTTREAYILYLHGNMGSRALDHRVNMYKKLSKMGFHILTIDYRGFGDSEGWPTEQGLVEDSKVAYKWMMDKYAGFPLYIWGHSLGSAVGLQLAAWLNSERALLNGVILEAPFNNMTDAIMQTPLAAPFVPFIPNFESYIDDVKNVFRSSYWITKTSTPIQILHDKSDNIINIALGRRLYLSGQAIATCNVKMIELDENLYHKNMYAAKKLKAIVSNFIHYTS